MVTLGTVLLVTEKEFAAQVCELAELYGWSWAHFRPAQNRRGHWQTPVAGPLGAGWPDLVLVRDRDGRMMHVELKAQKTRLSDDQSVVLDYLRRVARFHGWYEVHVWRPSDWDEIVERLR